MENEGYELGIGHVDLEGKKFYINGSIKNVLDGVFGYTIKSTPITNKNKIRLLEEIVLQNAKISNLKSDLKQAEKTLDNYSSQLRKKK